MLNATVHLHVVHMVHVQILVVRARHLIPVPHAKHYRVMAYAVPMVPVQQVGVCATVVGLVPGAIAVVHAVRMVHVQIPVVRVRHLILVPRAILFHVMVHVVHMVHAQQVDVDVTTDGLVLPVCVHPSE